MTAPVCQSCAMPMTSPELQGTESGGGKSADYCVHCYAEGQFLTPNRTLPEMIEICIPFMEGMSPDQARQLLTETLPQLKRWRSA